MSREKKKEKVIRPPIEQITSGKIFRPAKAMRNKMWLQAFVLIYLLWLAVIVGAFGIGYLVLVLDQGRTLAYYVVVMSDLWMHINFWFLVIGYSIQLLLNQEKLCRRFTSRRESLQ
ncbi:MAG: hypothetical protein ACW97A_14600 [Candidatus Thorarchaeota archaeon]